MQLQENQKIARMQSDTQQTRRKLHRLIAKGRHWTTRAISSKKKYIYIYSIPKVYKLNTSIDCSRLWEEKVQLKNEGL